MPVGEAGKVVDDFRVRLEPGLGRLLRIGFEVVDAADAIEQLEPQARIVAQEPADLDQVGRFDHDEGVDGRRASST